MQIFLNICFLLKIKLMSVNFLLEKTNIKLIPLVVVLSGCFGESSGIAPVSGTITFKGKPLPNASITFTPEDSASRTAVGSTDKDGKYQLTSFKSKDGAKIGKYKVTIRAEEGGDSNLKPADALDFVRGKILTPIKYSNAESSGLSAEVLNKNNVFDFELRD